MLMQVWSADTEEGLSEFPHVILNQARLHDFFLDEMVKFGLRPTYGTELLALQHDRFSERQTVSVESIDREGHKSSRNIQARYVVGCDGGRSKVRKALGLKLRGESAHAAWGVADVLVESDFPDLRFKCIIRSKSAGSLQIIPREGGYLIRIYVEMEKLEANERVAQRGLGYDDIITAAQRIFSPYTFEVKECVWWSIYEIGQRLTERFDNASDTVTPNAFICGDACHTHSPKAGQGMNVSMQDALNLGWKLIQVLQKNATPDLLRTYSEERQACAKDLIEFDHELAYVFSGKNNVDAAYFEAFFKKSAQYMAGVAIQYNTSLITVAANACRQDLATGYTIGRRFHSEVVLRVADARKIHLAHEMPADARWRMLIFPGSSTSQAMDLCHWLENSAESPVVRTTPASHDVDSIIDVRAIFSASHAGTHLESLPAILWPRKGKYGLRDYEKIFCDRWETAENTMPSIYETRGITKEQGCVLVVRPDQHVSAVFSLDSRDAIASFFLAFLLTKA